MGAVGLERVSRWLSLEFSFDHLLRLEHLKRPVSTKR